MNNTITDTEIIIVSDMIAQIEIAMSKNNWDNAIKQLQEVIKKLKDRTPTDIYILLSIAYRNQNNLKIAQKLLQFALIKNPDNTKILIELEKIFKETKNWSEQIRISKILKAISVTKNENWEKALRCWKVAREISPNLSRSNYISFAKVCEMNNEWSLHKDVVQEALKIYPDNHDLRLRLIYNRVVSNCNKKKWSQALKDIQILFKNYKLLNTSFAINYLYKKIIIFKKLECCSKTHRKALLYDEFSFRRTRTYSFDALCMDDHFEFYNSSNKFSNIIKSLCKHIMHTDEELDEKIPDEVSSIIKDKLANYDYPDLTGVDFSPYGWKFLSFISTKSGYVKLGWTFKKLMMHSLEKLRKQNDSTMSSHFVFLRDQILLTNENGDTDYFNFLLKQISSLGVNKDFITLSKLYHGTYQKGDFQIDSSDKYFLDLINGKNIAIVGPIDVGLNNGDEIDSNDIIIRFTFNGIEIYDQNKFGSRTEISYYTFNYIPFAINQKLFNSMNKLECAILHQESFNTCHWVKSLRTNVRKRYNVYDSDTNPFLCGFANSVQRTLMDILRFNPKKIKVYNANLFLSQNYVGKYASKKGFAGVLTKKESNLAKINGGLSFHEPSSNFIFLQRLYQNGYIQVDSVLDDILSMNVDQYMHKLDQRYSVADYHQ